MHVCSVLTLVDSMDCSPRGSSSMEFSRQEYWSGLPLPPPGNLSDPGVEPTSSESPSFFMQIVYHLSHLGSPKGEGYRGLKFHLDFTLDPC